jgi:acyl-CoA synthetase (AMP-forming)/AMP-acid ligase II
MGSSRADRAQPRDPAALSVWRTDPPDLITDAIGQVLARQVAAAGDHPALLWLDGAELRRMTFAELSDAATAIARPLAARTAPGDRVAIWSRNSVEWVLTHYACALAGLVVAPFNTAWTDPEVRYAMELTSPTMVFAGLDRGGAGLAARAAGLRAGAAVLDLADVREWADNSARAPLPAVGPRDPFLIQFTSGTTGRAKGAVLNHGALLNAALVRLTHHDPNTRGAWLNPVPYHHVGGFCHVVLGGLVKADPIVVLDRFDPDVVAGLLRRRLVSYLGGVPTMITDIVDRVGDAGLDTGLVSVGAGGATVTRHLIERVRATFGAAVTVTYGQSECPTITHTPPDAAPEIVSTTVGRPVPGCEVRIVDPDSGRVVPRGAIGEITVRSPYLMDGYWRMPEQTADVVDRDGFLRTGDLGSMDAEGNVTFRGRRRDVIIRGGENIYPAEVEEILVAHPDIADVVLVGVGDDRLGERVVGVVVRSPGAAVTGAQLTEFLRDRVAYFKIPGEWRFMDSLPMTASGKVQRFRVRETVADSPAH